MKQFIFLLVAIFICTTGFLSHPPQNDKGQPVSEIVNDGLIQSTAMIGTFQVLALQGVNNGCLREFYAAVVSCVRTSTSFSTLATCLRAAYARLVECLHEE